MVEININDNVYVKLTDLGRKELERQKEALRKQIPALEGLSFEREEDEEGWSKWQLWDLMNTFGHLLTLGRDVPFETTIRIGYKEGE